MRGTRPDAPEYGYKMISRALVLAAIPVVLLVASASAAQRGSYSGTSVNKEIFLYGDVDPRTDKGKVTFKVRANAAKEFKLTAQQFMCGATTAEIPVKVAKITLNATGQGKGTYTDPSTGVFEVKLKVRDNGRASGTITPKGLCRGKVTFTAKRS
jgi:hypothetical protein